MLTWETMSKTNAQISEMMNQPILIVIRYEDCLCNITKIIEEELQTKITKQPTKETYKKYISKCTNINESMISWLNGLSGIVTVVSYSDIPLHAKEKLSTELLDLSDFEVIHNNKELIPFLHIPLTLLVDHNKKVLRNNPPYVIVDRPWNKLISGIRIKPWED